MASYRNILDFVRKWEDGLVYFPEEGQYTNRGVQWTTFKALAPKLLGIKNPTVDDLKDMSQAQGDKFIEYYWNLATDGNRIENQAVANAFFEALWGGGQSGVKWLQKKLGVYPDGRVGNVTVSAANKADPETTVKEILNRFNYLAESSPSRYGRFIDGWRNRWNDLYRISKPFFFETLPGVTVFEKKNNNLGKIALFAGVGAVIYYFYTKKKNK